MVVTKQGPRWTRTSRLVVSRIERPFWNRKIGLNHFRVKLQVRAFFFNLTNRAIFMQVKFTHLTPGIRLSPAFPVLFHSLENPLQLHKAIREFDEPENFYFETNFHQSEKMHCLEMFKTWYELKVKYVRKRKFVFFNWIILSQKKTSKTKSVFKILYETGLKSILENGRFYLPTTVQSICDSTIFKLTRTTCVWEAAFASFGKVGRPNF